MAEKSRPSENVESRQGPCDGFAEFCDEMGWDFGTADAARRLAQLRMMRGLPPLSEAEWNQWEESRHGNDWCAAAARLR